MQSNGASTTLNVPVASNSNSSSSGSKGKSSGSKFKSLFQKLHRTPAAQAQAHGTVNGRTGSPPATASATSTATGKQPAQKPSQKGVQSNANAIRGSQTPSTSAGSGGALSANGPDLPKSPSPAQQVKDAANRDSRKPSNGAMDVSSGSRKDAVASTSNSNYTNADHSTTTASDEYLEPGEEDGADANASLRPHTPSTIDASSSFTGSRRNSNGSLAPTSRTFKSFVTGHSKTSASTKPTTLATSSNANPGSTSADSTAVAGADSDMREGGANRIATQMHESDAKDASALAPSSGQTPSIKPSPLRNSIEGIPMIAHEERGQSSGSGSPSTSTGGHLDRPNLTSSNSITFSALPPASPALQQHASSPTSPLMPSSASVRSFANSLNGPNGPSGSLTHYPRHSHHDPKNNPRASSPPPDNASILTLASSTAPSVYGSVRTPGAGGSIAESGRVQHKSSLGGLGAANEDASIRAIPPSRRESGESFGSKWSAAILSTRDTNRDGKESYYTASVMNAEQ